MHDGTVSAPVDPVAPSRQDPFAHGASELYGGPVGGHAARRTSWFWVPVRVVLVLMVVGLGIAYLQKLPCSTHAWSGEYQYTRMCYSDVYALYYAEGLDRGQVPYKDHPVEYPVVIGGMMQAASWVASHADPADKADVFFDASVAMLAVGGLVVAWSTVRLAGRSRPWDAAMLAVSPVLFVHAFTNWDLAAAAFAGAGLWAWNRRRPAWAGVLLGLGVATKLYPVLLIGALFLLCLRAGRQRAWAVMFGAAALTWLLVDLPVWIAWPASFGRFYSLNRSRPADWDSLWFAIEHWRGKPLDSGLLPGQSPTILNTLSAAAFVLVAISIAVLVLRAPRRPRVAQVGLLVVVGFLLTSKVYSPQYAIWLLPLVVLARPRWPAVLAWQATEVLLLFMRFYFFVGHDHAGQGLPIGFFLAGVVIRDLVLVVICALVVREIWSPRRDVVRAEGVDDPAGGVLAGSEDRIVLPGPRVAATAGKPALT
jgi:uncharacterized membrane protein